MYRLLSRSTHQLNYYANSNPFVHKSIVAKYSSDMKDILSQTKEVIVVNPINEKGDKLPYIEDRKLDDELVPKIQENLSYLAGVPQEHVVERLARIAKAPKNCMQSGTDNTKSWILQFDNRGRWENNLMGWISSGDPLSNLQIRFNTAEEAIDYCQRNRYPYFVVQEKETTTKKKSYGAIFSWNKRTRSSTK